MVLFDIDDERIKKSAVETFKRAFRSEFKEIMSRSYPRKEQFVLDSAIDRLFDFYGRHITRVKLGNFLHPRSPAMPLVWGLRENLSYEKAEIVLPIPVSMREKFTNPEIIGIIANAIGHIYNEYHYDSCSEPQGRDKTYAGRLRHADETAKKLGFGKEILALRARIPLSRSSRTV